MTSLAFSFSFVPRAGQPRLVKRVAIAMAAIAVAGIAGTLIGDALAPLVANLDPRH